MSLVFGYFIVNEFYTASTNVMPSVVQNQLIETQAALTFGDYAYPLAVILLAVVLIYTYLFVPANRILLIPEFITLGVVILMGSITSNFWGNMFNNTNFNNTITQFPLTNQINNNFGLLGSLVGLLVLLALFMKKGGEGGAIVG